ncbi:MAG TPA: hypothetical protein V6C99_04685 [Oculatellaceae cyanobacterium]
MMKFTLTALCKDIYEKEKLFEGITKTGAVIEDHWIKFSSQEVVVRVSVEPDEGVRIFKEFIDNLGRYATLTSGSRGR